MPVRNYCCIASYDGKTHRRMLEVPKVRTSVNLMGFLGLHPITGTPLPWASVSPSNNVPRHNTTEGIRKDSDRERTPGRANENTGGRPGGDIGLGSGKSRV